MNLLMARSGYSPSGGAERYLMRLASGAARAGIEPVLVTTSAWPANTWPAGRIERLAGGSPASFAGQVEALRRRHSNAVLFAMERLPCADVYRAGDGVHASWLDRLGAEDTALSSWLRRRRRMHRQLLALEHKLFTRCPKLRVIANSTLVADEITQRFGFPAERLHVIANGCDSPAAEPSEVAQARTTLRARLAIPADAPLVLFLGSGFKRKGAALLVNAFARVQHPSARLVIAGKGRLRGNMPHNVHLVGAVTTPREYLLAADLFALPTLYDPFSNACVEAAAHGLPVLTTDANGFAEALAAHPGAGEVISVPRDVDRWAQALARWLAPGTVKAAAPAVRALATEYTLTANIAATLAVVSAVHAP